MLLWLATAIGASPVVGQDPDLVPLRGVVRDALTNAPLVGARVQIDGVRGGTLTDSTGAFELERTPTGPQLLVVEHYGFESVGLSITVGSATAPGIEVRLPPRPVMLDGLSVVTDRLARMEARLQSRRRAVATSARAFELDRLMRSGARDITEFLQHEANVPLAPCGRSPFDLCAHRRGRWVRPTVYIDEVPAIGGLDQLGTYLPHELYLIEVYDSGLHIRAYTHFFMERMARRPIPLVPINW